MAAEPVATPEVDPSVTPVAVPTAEAPATVTPMPTPDLEGQLNEIRAFATVIGVGESVKGDIKDQGDIHYFRFQANATGPYRIYLSSFSYSHQSSELSARLTLYDSSGMELSSIDQVTHWEAPNSGDYYLAVALNHAADYQLVVSRACVVGNTVQEWTSADFWRAADLAQVQAVLKNCFKYIEVQATTSFGASPLFLAARYTENPAVLQAVLDAGSNPKAKDIGGASLLAWAARDNGNPEVIQVLLDAGVSQDTKDEGLNWAASYNNNPAVLQVLLDAGANPDVKAVP